MNTWPRYQALQHVVLLPLIWQSSGPFQAASFYTHLSVLFFLLSALLCCSSIRLIRVSLFSSENLAPLQRLLPLRSPKATFRANFISALYAAGVIIFLNKYNCFSTAQILMGWCPLLIWHFCKLFILTTFYRTWSKTCLIQTAQMIILIICYVNTNLVLAPLRSLQRLLYLKLISPAGLIKHLSASVVEGRLHPAASTWASESLLG